MALTIRDAARSGQAGGDVGESSVIRAAAVKKPKSAKGTGKKTTAKAAPVSVKKAYPYVPPKPKKTVPVRQLAVSAIGPGANELPAAPAQQWIFSAGLHFLLGGGLCFDEEVVEQLLLLGCRRRALLLAVVVEQVPQEG